MSAASNLMTVTLTANYDLSTGSTVTVTKLAGSATASSSSLAVTTCESSSLGSSGDWDKDTGTLILTVATTVGQTQTARSSSH